jgi:sialate O-acetylesterase
VQIKLAKVNNDLTGVRIDAGPQSFQVFQQDEHGVAAIEVSGRWAHSAQAIVQLRIVQESDGATVIDWQSARTVTGPQWSHRFENVPAGGLYRIETRLVRNDTPPEWGPHGDVIHHLAVGDLWVIAGQSNAAGYGRGPIDDPPELGIHILKNNERWDIAAHPLNDPTGSTHANVEIANPGHSPYLAFARHLRRSLNYPIGLIQTALGNTALSEWNPTENPQAPLYRNLIHCVNLAGGRVRGMLWYQGESDTNPGLAETYESRFASFVSRLRADLHDPHLPIIIAQSNRYTGPQSAEEHRGWSRVREAQRNATKLGHIAVVPTLDLPLSDDCHTSPPGNLLLGHRKARAALAMVYQRAAASEYPDVIEAIRGIDGRSIELRFKHVASRLAFIAPGEADFMIEDAGGFVPVRKAECVARDRVRLSLATPVSTAARIHSAYGANPAAFLRDIEPNVPILAFYGLAVR